MSRNDDVDKNKIVTATITKGQKINKYLHHNIVE